MNNVSFIICSAGQGLRMKSLAPDTPKHLMSLNSKTLIEWSLLSLPLRPGDELIFLTQKSFPQKEITEKLISSFCQRHQTSVQFVYLEKTTRGQAETASLARTFVHHERIALFNNDTYFKCSQLDHLIHENDVKFLAPCFKAPGDEWSFFKTRGPGPLFSVTEVAEKIRISDWCSTGFYYFAHKNMFFDLIEQQLTQKNISKELYIAPLYNHFINQDIKVVECEEFKPMGTPQQIEKFWEHYKDVKNENK